MKKDYPREDQQIVLHLADGCSISGLVNVAGRGVLALVQDSDPHVLLYDATSEDGRAYETALVSKHQILWVEAPAGQEEQPDLGNWQSAKFRMTTGHEISGEVDITGFDRASEYFRAHAGRFYEVYARVAADKPPQLRFVASAHVVLRELVS